MSQPVNTYYPGEPLPDSLHSIGRPVTLFVGETIKAGTIVALIQTADGELLHDVQAADGGTYRKVRLGTLMNPQPNTFVFAP